MSPQGRLTLQAGKPIMDAPDLFADTVYYSPYIGDTVPQWDGSKFVDIECNELALPLSGTLAGTLHDVFVDGGALALGPAWTNTLTRGYAINLVKGVRCDDNHRPYLGSVYITEAGHTRFQLKPTPIPYGTANILGLWNSYNRVRVTALCRDSITSWLHGSADPHFVNNSNRWRISWIDGLAQSYVKASHLTSVAGYTNDPTAATVDAVLDAAYPIHLADELCQAALNSTAIGLMLEGRSSTLPLLGLHYYQSVEQSTAVSIMFYGNDFSALNVELEM